MTPVEIFNKYNKENIENVKINTRYGILTLLVNCEKTKVMLFYPFGFNLNHRKEIGVNNSQDLSSDEIEHLFNELRIK